MDLLELLRGQPLNQFGEIRTWGAGQSPETPWLEKLNSNDCHIVNQVRCGDRTEALLFHERSYLLVKYAPSGHRDNNGKQYGYTVQEIESPFLNQQQVPNKLFTLPIVLVSISIVLVIVSSLPKEIV